jgi:NAD(P)-dependent dehydrogenase (short-subunit alcohol dehydrogenase family)
MSRVSVLTGGAGGMGSATAKVIGRDHTVVLCDIRQDRLDATGRHPERPRNHPTIVNRDVTDPGLSLGCSRPHPVSHDHLSDPYRRREPQHG